MKRRIDVPPISGNRPVVLKSMGNVCEICIADHLNSRATIQPLSKDEYVLLSTGEVKERQLHAENRLENIRNLEKTMHCLSDLINANISPENADCCRFITLTYRDNMRDEKRLYSDFRNYNKRFKRYMKNEGYCFEYIVTIEAQGRGAFHLHCIYIFNQKAPFIENALLSELWGLGFVSIKACDSNIDDIGRYLTAYLADLPIDESDEAVTSAGGCIKEASDKRIIKGGRLKLLPAGIRLYRYSKGINKPEVRRTTYRAALKELEGFTKVDEYAIEIADDGRDFKSTYIKQRYKKFINKERIIENEIQSKKNS